MIVLTLQQRKTVVDLLRRRASYVAIRAATGMGYGTISKWAKRYGLTRRSHSPYCKHGAPKTEPCEGCREAKRCYDRARYHAATTVEWRQSA